MKNKSQAKQHNISQIENFENTVHRRNINLEEENEISDQPHEILSSNFAKRTFFTIIMIGLFIFISSCKIIYLICLVIFLSLLILKELIAISKTHQGYPFPSYIILGFASIIYLYYVSDALPFYPGFVLSFKRGYFYAYISCLILFVCSLKGGKLKKQFALFSLIHLSSYLVGICCRSAIRNVKIGKFWLFFPSTLVISNDIFAYIVGKSIGRTPLFRLIVSPKKTVEGFIGGFVFTTIYGVIFSYLQLRYYLIDDSYINELRQVCHIYNIISIPYMYIHCLIFVLVASFVAPFSGFFASALKRVYNKKDFGNSIPGHGGITDRFDCQCIMVLFTTVYLKSFLKTKEQILESCFFYITGSFTKEEIEMLMSMLSKYLRKSN